MTADLTFATNRGGGITDHGALGGLADDDHAGYFWALGRTGGQTGFGGIASGEDLTVTGNTSPSAGNIALGSPIAFQADIPTKLHNRQLAGGVQWVGHVASGVTTITGFGVPFAGYIESFLRFAPNYDAQSTLYQFNALQVAGTFNRLGVSLSPFTAFLLFNAFPTIKCTRGGVSDAPLAPTILRAGPIVQNDGGGSSQAACPESVGVLWDAIFSATTSGDTLTCSNPTAYSCRPGFGTVSGSDVAITTMRYVRMQSPVTGFGQLEDGDVTIATMVGIEAANWAAPIDTNISITAGKFIRCALNESGIAGSDFKFIEHNGDAPSTLGGRFTWDDSVPSEWGTGRDVGAAWDNTAARWDLGSSLSGLDTRLRFDFGGTTSGVTEIEPSNSAHFLGLDIATDFMRGLALFENTPAQLTTDVTNYDVGDGSSRRVVIRLDSSTNVNISGMRIGTAGTDYRGAVVVLVNTGANDITLLHQSGGASNSHRFISPTGAGYVLSGDQTAVCWYDTVETAGNGRWRIIAGTGG